MLKLIRTALTALMVTSAVPVIAQEFCRDPDDQAVIVSLGQTILQKRPELPRIQSRRFGAHALYLMMRYDRVSDETVERELTAMIADGVPLARDLAFAWSHGMSDGTAERLLGPVGVTDLVRNGVSAIRAIIREGDIEPLMSALETDDLGTLSTFRSIVVATLDYTDEQKAALAKAAMAHGLPMLAAGFIAAHKKPKAWTAFAETLDPATLEQATQGWYWLPPAMGNPMLPRETDQQEPGPSGFTPAKAGEITIAGMSTPQYDYLGTILNQTGEVDKVLAAARAVNEAMASGRLDRRETLDETWLLAYQTLSEVWGDIKQLQGQLSSFEITTERRGGTDRTLGMLDHIVAIDVLTPYLRGEAAEPPEMPALLSPNAAAEWPKWLETAELVKANSGDPVHIGEDTMAAEMLFAAGEFNRLANLIAEAPASLQLLRLATDMAIRLDRKCESYLWHPAESLLLAGTPIFKFDDRDNR